MHVDTDTERPYQEYSIKSYETDPTIAKIENLNLTQTKVSINWYQNWFKLEGTRTGSI